MWLHRWQPTRLPRPWDSPGKNTEVRYYFLLQCMKVKSESEVTQSCPTLPDPIDCSLPGSSIHGISQARVLESVAIAFSDTHHSSKKKKNKEKEKIATSNKVKDTCSKHKLISGKCPANEKKCLKNHFISNFHTYAEMQQLQLWNMIRNIPKFCLLRLEHCTKCIIFPSINGYLSHTKYSRHHFTN